MNKLSEQISVFSIQYLNQLYLGKLPGIISQDGEKWLDVITQ